MSDDSQLPQDPAQQPAAPAGDDQKNPLDVLEELLAQSQASAGGGAPALGQPATNPTAPPEPDSAEVARQEAERQAAAAQQEQVDQQEIAAQRQALEAVKETPEYQARVQQIEEEKAEQTQQHANQDGFEVNQLEHKKI